MNQDGTVGTFDIDFLNHAVRDFAAGDTAALTDATDVNGDGTLSEADIDFLIEDLLGTVKGDLNLDGRLNRDDFDVFSATTLAARYGPLTPDDLNYQLGDLNSDGVLTYQEFTVFWPSLSPPGEVRGRLADLLDGAVTVSGNASVAIPEPSAFGVIALSLLGFRSRRRA